MSQPAQAARVTPIGVVQTVTGPVAAADLGLILPHEHLFNDLSGVVDEPSYAFSRAVVHEPVSAAIAWALRQDPYCCVDNMAGKSVAEVSAEITSFAALGGRTVVDATPSPVIGRNPQRLLEVARGTGLNIVMGCGAYLEKFEGDAIAARAIDVQAAAISAELTYGVGQTGIRPGVIGEIGVSPDFTAGEHASLRASALAQLDHPHVPLLIHLPGWQRRAHEILDVVVGEMGVRPEKVVLAHMDPSAEDSDYQRSVADRGVWIEFDMVGMDVTFPKEGASPDPHVTSRAVHGLITAGFAGQILLSHDVFLKQMWVHNGGNGFAYVPTVFTEMLAKRGIERGVLDALIRDNPARMLTA
ncbi:phosphotriesterase-related protein [Sanguibacter gelidistatuariae]|uniref:Phosphotriesterase-related protein n=1 Tax=Sanguibacter gelidistatuariae TaxID=1814289 RepID=A0A1G6XN98_9MICO|nr:phosphotriesterase [Sanguibacter gelidistatuariae]SDD78746.1 phosphotriesterase-related protein [Sanguibacter gelidistatuariae]